MAAISYALVDIKSIDQRRYFEYLSLDMQITSPIFQRKQLVQIARESLRGEYGHDVVATLNEANRSQQIMTAGRGPQPVGMGAALSERNLIVDKFLSMDKYPCLTKTASMSTLAIQTPWATAQQLIRA